MKILVTGSNGQLGNELRLVLPQDMAGVPLLFADKNELDLTDAAAVKRYLEDYEVTHIVNCAAYTAVDKAEEDKALCAAVNVDAVKNLAVAADSLGAKIIHISTDYVFDGNGTRPYRETDLVGPQGAYGRTKLAGEEYVREFSDRHFILRTAWLYGDGKNFVRTMLRLSETNDKVRVVHDQVGSPTSAKELAKAIAYLLPTENYGLFHATCEGDCSWAQFTEEIFRLAGKKTVVEGITSEEYGAAVKRPAYSILENYMFKMTTDFQFADWHEAIAEYLK